MNVSAANKKEQRLVIPITAEQKKLVEEYARLEGVSSAQVVRKLINEFFRNNLPQKPNRR